MEKDIFYLIEEYDASLDYKDGNAISLTPQASYRLGREGKEYSIIEDFYSEQEMRSREEPYFFRQLEWIARFDGFLKERIDFCRQNNIGVAHAYYSKLKYFIDSIVVQSFIMSEFLKNSGAKEIIYIYKEHDGDEAQAMHEFTASKKTFFAQLLPLFCKERGISLKLKAMPGKTPFAEVRRGSLKGLLKRHLRSIFYIYKYKRWKALMPGKRKGPVLKALFLHSGSPIISPVIERFISEGQRVFIKRDDRVFSLDGILEKTVLTLPDSTQKDIQDDCKEAASALNTDGSLFEWINSECNIDVSSIIMPYIESFVSKTAPEILSQALVLSKFYKREGIDLVVATSSSDISPMSGLIGARLNGGVKSVCFQHGCSLLDSMVWYITELDAFDYYFTTETLSEEFFRQRSSSSYISRCEVYQSPHYLKSVSDMRRIKGPSSGKRERIMYVPSKPRFHTRCFNNMTHPIVWFFELQKAIIDFFGSQGDYDLIYKEPASPEPWREASIISYIRDKDYGNVSVDRRRLSECLHEVDRVFFDRPSTGLYEAAVLGKPVMSLYYPGLIDEYKPAIEMFADSARPFSTIDEAIAIIDSFLKDDPERYKVKIPIKDTNPIDILQDAKLQEV